MRKLVGAVVAGLVLAALCSLALPGRLWVSATPDPMAPLPAASHTPAEVAAADALARAIRDAPPDDSAPSGWMWGLRQSGGIPDVEVSGGTATVFTAWANVEPTQPRAWRFCVQVASLAVGVGTGLPGGIRTIVIAGGSGREVLYTCGPPPPAT